MKLKEFNTETCANLKQDTSTPSVQINMSTGLFRFNFKASEQLGLQDEDQVIFHQDEEQQDCWYVEKVKAKGFVVRHKEAVGKGVLFNNSKLAREIAQSVDFTGKSGKCLLPGVPTKFEKRILYGVLTGTLINK